MKNAIQRIAMILIALTVVIAAILISILVLPVIISFKIQSIPGNKRRNEYYKAFIDENNGTQFFCYNNKKDSREFIESILIPKLEPHIEIIFLDGKTPISKYEQVAISRMLYSIEQRRGFPYLLKIVDGEVVNDSIHSELYKTMNQNKDINLLLNKMSAFYSD